MSIRKPPKVKRKNKIKFDIYFVWHHWSIGIGYYPIKQIMINLLFFDILIYWYDKPDYMRRIRKYYGEYK